VVSWIDFAAIFAMPLLLGSATAWFFRGRWRAAVGCVVATICCYWFRLTADEWSFVASDSRTVADLITSLGAGVRQICAPKSAIHWVPIATVVVFAVDRVCALWPRHENLGETSVPKRSVLLFSVHGVVYTLVFCGIVSKLLWTSVYFTDSYATWQQLSFVLVPGLLLSSVWWFARSASEEIGDATHGILSVAAIAGSASAVLGSSGSIQYSLFVAGTLVYSLVMFLLQQETVATRNRPMAGILAATIGLPIALGYFFAEVSIVSGLLIWGSLLLLVTYWPKQNANILTKWARAVLIAAPALVAMGICAFQFANATEPATEYNPYSNL